MRWLLPYIFEYVQPEHLSLHHRSCPFITGLVLLSQVLSFYHRSCPFTLSWIHLAFSWLPLQSSYCLFPTQTVAQLISLFVLTIPALTPRSAVMGKLTVDSMAEMKMIAVSRMPLSCLFVGVFLRMHSE